MSAEPHLNGARRNAMSIPFGSAYRRLGDLITQHADQMEYITITNLSSHDRRCALCKRKMCDYHPHTCRNDLECENAYCMKPCGHIAGQECLLRALEKRPFCPICRYVAFAPDIVLATAMEEQSDTASDPTIGMAL
jgi:hypothetical protein